MSWVVYSQHVSVLRGNINYNSQLALNASAFTTTSGEPVVMPDVHSQLAPSLCEGKVCESGLLGAGGVSLEDERHASPKVRAAFLRFISKATCCLAHVL